MFPQMHGLQHKDETHLSRWAFSDARQRQRVGAVIKEVTHANQLMFVKRRRAALAFLEERAKSLAEENSQVDEEIDHLEQLQVKRTKMRNFKEQQEKAMGVSGRDPSWRDKDHEQERLLRQELAALRDIKKQFSKINTAELFRRAGIETDAKVAKAKHQALERAKKSGSGNTKRVQAMLGEEVDSDDD